MSLTSLTSPNREEHGPSQTNWDSRAPGRFARLGQGDSRATGPDIGARARPMRTADVRPRRGRPEQGRAAFLRRPSHPGYSGAAPDRRSNGGSQPVPCSTASASAAMASFFRSLSRVAASGDTPSATASAIFALVTRPK